MIYGKPVHLVSLGMNIPRARISGRIAPSHSHHDALRRVRFVERVRQVTGEPWLAAEAGVVRV